MRGPDSTNGYRSLVLLFGLLLVSSIMMYQLFGKSYGAGGMYPEYSSLRADRHGTKLLADGLQKAGYPVKRSYHQLRKIKIAPSTTLFFIGLNGYRDLSLLSKAQEEESPFFPKEGSRLVMTMWPDMAALPPEVEPEEDNVTAESETEAESEAEAESPPSEEQDTAQVQDEESEETEEDCNCPPSYLGLTIKQFEKGEREDRLFRAMAHGVVGTEFLQIPWHSAAYFTDLDESWTVVLRVADQPVLIEKKLGKGSIVVATDSHFLSNEVISHDRNSFFLLWLLGGNKNVVFDEAHHGVQHQESVGKLIRDFDLYWVFIALAVPALLFVLRSSMPLLPPVSDAQHQKASREGRDQFTGLVNILRRHPPEDFLRSCISLWLKANQSWAERHPEQEEKINSIARDLSANEVVRGYKNIVRIIHE